MPIHRILKDEEINDLLRERKPLPENWRVRLKLLPKTGFKHLQRDLQVRGVNGNTFRIILRQSIMNLSDFSVILVFQDKDGTEFRLCRYNGKHPSEHTNKLEEARGDRNAEFRNQFHIHWATERYQQGGFEIDGYAETTDRYCSFGSALTEFLGAHGFQLPEENLPLFDDQGDAR
jgi:hypothetical protein